MPRQRNVTVRQHLSHQKKPPPHSISRQKSRSPLTCNVTNDNLRRGGTAEEYVKVSRKRNITANTALSNTKRFSHEKVFHLSKNRFTVLFAALLSLMTSSCEKEPEPTDPLVGTWVNTDNSFFEVLCFDGSVFYSGELSAGELTITFKNRVFQGYTFRLEAHPQSPQVDFGRDGKVNFIKDTLILSTSKIVVKGITDTTLVLDGVHDRTFTESNHWELVRAIK